MSRANVLDASALLALLKGETGWEIVATYLPFSTMSAVNVSEAVAKSVENGADPVIVRERILDKEMVILPFEQDDAFTAGNLRSTTREYGLSFGDRACLALAQRLDMPVLTSDLAWQGLDIGVELIFIR